MLFVNSLWPPCVADADIIFLPCGFFFLLSFFLSLSNLSRRRLDDDDDDEGICRARHK